MVDEVVVVAKRDEGWLRAGVEHEEREDDANAAAWSKRTNRRPATVDVHPGIASVVKKRIATTASSPDAIDDTSTAVTTSSLTPMSSECTDKADSPCVDEVDEIHPRLARETRRPHGRDARLAGTRRLEHRGGVVVPELRDDDEPPQLRRRE